MLAGAALRDPAALGRLRAIDVVDGRPVPLSTALRGTRADVLARLRVLAQPADGPTAAASPRAARGAASDILDARRFTAGGVPAPLRAVRERIGAALSSLGPPLRSAFAWLAGRLPGGEPALWALLATGVLALASLFAGRAGARRVGARGQAAGAGEAGPEDRASAARLRKEASRAERQGDLDEALRLRFRAGLVELDSRDLLDLRPALTNRELLDAVPSPTLATLVDGFEAVAYGGRPAQPEDLRRAREGWPLVADEVGTR